MDRGGEGVQLPRQVDMRWTEGGRGPTTTSGGHEVDRGGEGVQLPRQVDMRWTEGGKGSNCHVRWT